MATEDLFVTNTILQPVADALGVSIEVVMAIMIIVSVWSLIWKGFALWKASKKNHKFWFIAILILNTVGILEILYIYVFSKMNFKNKNNLSVKKK